MRNTKIIFILAAALMLFSLSIDQNAQTKRRKPSVRNRQSVGQKTPAGPPQRSTVAPALPPVKVNPKVLEPEVVSTAQEDEMAADETINQTATESTDSTEKQTQNSSDQTASSTSALSQQVEKLNNKLNSLDGDQRSLINLEKLTRAEERAELLRKQLENAIEKETALNSRLEQLEYQGRPEIIERDMAGVGSTRPEEVRETRRKMLENEKLRAKQQLGQIKDSRTRLETAVANAESLVEKLSAIVESENRAKKAADNSSNNTSNFPNNESQPQ